MIIIESEREKERERDENKEQKSRKRQMKRKRMRRKKRIRRRKRMRKKKKIECSQSAPDSGFKGINRHHCLKDKVFISISNQIILCDCTLQNLFCLNLKEVCMKNMMAKLTFSITT